MMLNLLGPQTPQAMARLRAGAAEEGPTSALGVLVAHIAAAATVAELAAAEAVACDAAALEVCGGLAGGLPESGASSSGSGSGSGRSSSSSEGEGDGVAGSNSGESGSNVGCACGDGDVAVLIKAHIAAGDDAAAKDSVE